MAGILTSNIIHCVIETSSVPAKKLQRRLNPLNGLTVHECDRRQTDRQTDHATEKCVAIGGILQCVWLFM